MGWWKCKQLFFSGKSKGSLYPAWIYVDNWTPASVYRWRVGNVVCVYVCLCKAGVKWGQCHGLSCHVPSSSILPHSDNCCLLCSENYIFLSADTLVRKCVMECVMVCNMQAGKVYYWFQRKKMIHWKWCRPSPGSYSEFSVVFCPY